MATAMILLNAVFELSFTVDAGMSQANFWVIVDFRCDLP
jgi:hypothetical protein